MSDHSLTTIVTDSFTAPRYCHHLLKVLTGELVLFALALFERGALGVPMREAWLGGAALSLSWFLSLRVAYWLDHRGTFVTPDLWCDLALHAMPIAIAVIAVASRPLGAVLLVLCVASYVVSYPDASP